MVTFPLYMIEINLTGGGKDATGDDSDGDSGGYVSVVAGREKEQITGGESTMKIGKIAVLIILAVALVVGVASLGLAASDTAVTQTANFASADEALAWGKKLPRMVRGEVVDIGDGFFVIGEQEHTIYVGEGTKYFVVTVPRRALAQLRSQTGLERPGLGATESSLPAMRKPLSRLPWRNAEMAGAEPTLVRPERPELAPDLAQLEEGQGLRHIIWQKLRQLRHLGEPATFDDIEIGSKVVVLLVPGKDKPTAQVVLIIKPSVWGRIAGTITGVSGDSITIDPGNGGDEVTLEYNEDTLFILKGIIAVDAAAEQFARAIYNTETEIARVVRVWPETPQPVS